MRRMAICIVLVAMGCLSFSSQAFATDKAVDHGFNIFYKGFKKAAQKNDRQKIISLMAENFQWASDGLIPKAEALRNMDKMKVWGDMKSAIATSPITFVDTGCSEGQCYSVWSRKSQTGIIFKKTDDGRWHWVELRAD